MSKRGKILKEVKKGMGILKEAYMNAQTLSDDDLKWLWKKLRKLSIDFNEVQDDEQAFRQRLVNLEQKKWKPKPIDIDPNADDDLPF